MFVNSTIMVTPTVGGSQEVNYIPEGDLYRLIVSSKLPAAEKFERWVFEEVLPSIRKTGGYGNINLEQVIAQTATTVVSEVVRRLVPVLKDVVYGELTKPETVWETKVRKPLPAGIPDDKITEFAYSANDILEDLVGYKNFLASYIHVDELHDYVDSQTKQHRTSMRHIHTYFIPEVDGKLNCNAISTKKNMISVNNAIDKMCVEKFGVAFLTGEKSKSTESVESLKLKSKALELE